MSPVLSASRRRHASLTTRHEHHLWGPAPDAAVTQSTRSQSFAHHGALTGYAVLTREKSVPRSIPDNAGTITHDHLDTTTSVARKWAYPLRSSLLNTPRTLEWPHSFNQLHLAQFSIEQLVTSNTDIKWVFLFFFTFSCSSLRDLCYLR